MRIRFKVLIRINEEEREVIETKTNEYIYGDMYHQVRRAYSGYSNGYNHIGFCSYIEDNNLIVYGKLVEVGEYEEELERLKYYLDYIGVESRGNIKLIIEDEKFSIRVIRNLVNKYFNYEQVIKKSFNIDNRYSIKEKEIDNLNELADMTDENLEDIIELVIEDRTSHIDNSPIDFSDYPLLIFRDLDLEFESMKNYFQFVIELVKKSSRRISVKKDRRDFRNEKYQMRNLLRNLGFNGNRFKDLRGIFLKNLSGDVAFRKY